MDDLEAGVNVLGIFKTSLLEVIEDKLLRNK